MTLEASLTETKNWPFEELLNNIGRPVKDI